MLELTNSHPPSVSQSFSLADYHSLHGRDDPIYASIFAPLCLPLAGRGRDWRLRPSIIGLTVGPRRGWPCYLDSVMTSSRRGPSFPHRPGMAEVWFGGSIPLCMSIENTQNSLTECWGHARVSKTDRVRSGSKRGWWSPSCDAGSFFGSFSSPKECCEMKTSAGVLKEVGAYLKRENKRQHLESFELVCLFDFGLHLLLCEHPWQGCA